MPPHNVSTASYPPNASPTFGFFFAAPVFSNSKSSSLRLNKRFCNGSGSGVTTPAGFSLKNSKLAQKSKYKTGFYAPRDQTDSGEGECRARSSAGTSPSNAPP